MLILNRYQKTIDFLHQKLSLSSQKYGLGSRILLKPILDPVSRGQKSNGSRIRNTTTTKKLSLSFQKYGLEIPDPDKTHPGSQIQG
jgi:hypothetical protein